MAEGPVAALSEHPEGDFGSTDGTRGPLYFVGCGSRALPLPSNRSIARPIRIFVGLCAERLPLRQINGIDRRSYK